MTSTTIGVFVFLASQFGLSMSSAAGRAGNFQMRLISRHFVGYERRHDFIS